MEMYGILIPDHKENIEINIFHTFIFEGTFSCQFLRGGGEVVSSKKVSIQQNMSYVNPHVFVDFAWRCWKICTRITRETLLYCNYIVFSTPQPLFLEYIFIQIRKLFRHKPGTSFVLKTSSVQIGILTYSHK